MLLGRKPIFIGLLHALDEINKQRKPETLLHGSIACHLILPFLSQNLSTLLMFAF